MTDAGASHNRHDFLAGGGDIGASMRARDWSGSLLGPPQQWPQSLRMAVRLVLGNAHPMCLVWGDAGACVFNDACRSLLRGGIGGRAIGLPAAEVWAGHWALLGPLVGQAHGGEPAQRPLLLTTGNGADGERRWACSASPIGDGADSAGGVLLVFADAPHPFAPHAQSERERALQGRLLESEQRYREIVESAEDFAIVTTDAHGVICGWNIGAEHITGFDRSEAIGKPMDIIFTPEDRAAGVPEKEMQCALRERRAIDERWHQRRDGSRFWGSGLLMRMDAPRGGFVKFFRDRTVDHESDVALRESERRLRAAVLASPFPIMLHAEDGEVIELSRKWTELTGYAREELRTHFDWVHRAYPHNPADVEKVIAREFESGGENAAGEWEVRTRSGQSRLWDFHNVGVGQLPDGRRLQVSVAVDVTERKKAEEALQASELRYRTLFDSMDEGFCILQPVFDEDDRPVDYRYVEINPAFERHTGMQDALGRTIREIVPGIEQYWIDTYGRVAQTGEPIRFVQHAEALHRWFDVYAFGTGDPGAGQVAVLFTDITERKRSERALRELNATLEAQVAQRTVERDRTWRLSGDMFAIFDLEGFLRRANPAWGRILGLEPHEVEGRHHTALKHPEDCARGESALARMGQGEAVTDYEERYRHRDGSYRWISWVASAPDGELIYAVGRDVTADKRTRAALEAAESARREADAVYRAYFESTAESLFVIKVLADGGFSLEELNPAHQAATGLRMDELRGRRLENQVPPQVAASAMVNFRRAVATRQVQVYHEALDFGGQERHWNTVLAPVFGQDGRVTRLIGSARDVTAQMAAEDALRQAQKMEAVGQLTGGIAHDFNNLLGALVGSLDLIRRKPGDVERVQRFAEAGLRAAERGAKLTAQLLAFSRAQRIELKPLVVADLVLGMREMLARTLGPLVQLKLDLDEQKAPVLSDPTQLEMAILNLAINARDAMREIGELTITTAVRRIESDADLAPGDYVELAVRDTGTGMPPEVIARAFDPFFTTKGVGKGTGLGLSQVYGIARQAGGTVRIESREGAGSTVRILLPRTEAELGDVRLEDADCEGFPAAAATILVVDDDPDVRRVLVDSIDAIGYRVVEASDGPSGLAALAEHAPDLMMVDFAMPGMNGAEVARAARLLQPELPIVFASGYADTAAIEGVLGPEVAMLRKPFRIEELQSVLAEALLRG